MNWFGTVIRTCTRVKRARQQPVVELVLYSKYLTTRKTQAQSKRDQQVDLISRLLLVAFCADSTAITIVKLENSSTTVFRAPSRLSR